MNELSDGELWQRAADGDPEGFGVIFDRHAQAVRSYWGLLHDPVSDQVTRPDWPVRS
ncbi:hypothetical protein [Kineococcus xinjiangensis]|uniref:hypothetical protein n=1 Tax=Kineococcus xinjiangensis TaxID=512762 RepID=UPI001304E3C7|nr:hypothetical protein [Kineococcus xinjiangensis]